MNKEDEKSKENFKRLKKRNNDENVLYGDCNVFYKKNKILKKYTNSDIDNFECNVNMCYLYHEYCNKICIDNKESINIDECNKKCVDYYDQCLLTLKNTDFFKENTFEKCSISSQCINPNSTIDINCIKLNKNKINECCHNNCYRDNLNRKCDKYCDFLYDFYTLNKYNINYIKENYINSNLSLNKTTKIFKKHFYFKISNFIFIIFIISISYILYSFIKKCSFKNRSK
jgi:hypothetical protein